MKPTETAWAQLSALATHLSTQRDTILKRWRTATENVPELTIASSLTRFQFNDHIPGVLDAYADTLRAGSGPATRSAQKEEKAQISEHGLQRWQQGYQLRELTREWGHLQMCVLAELEDYALAHPDLETTVMPTARRAWSQLCWDGISDSATQYWRLHQAEATGYVRELEQALATLNELDQTRAAAWRETAHDLQGSLSLMTLATSVLERKDLPEPTRHEFSDLVQRGVQSLHEMLKDFMSLARLDAGLEQRQVAAFDAAQLLNDFCTTSQPLAQARGLFLKTDGPESLLVAGDSAKVLRILQNLLLNALKYTQRGGVTVLWKPVADQVANNWMFCVQDTGPGLDDGPAAPLARQLYEATQTANTAEAAQRKDLTAENFASAPTVAAQSQTLPASRLPGEGVGLSIVKRLCELLDASLELETSPGAGATFRVILPRQYEPGGK
jgi:signal transduction histidine kinase